MSMRVIDKKHAVCEVLPILPGAGSKDGFLRCQVGGKKSSIPIFQKLSPKGERPPECEHPNTAETLAMGRCVYQLNSMSRCGCPALDPAKNPHVWQEYVGRVHQIINEQISKKSDEITLTFFASGYLLQDLELLDSLFSSPSFANWKGTFILQFVDLKYETEKVDGIKKSIINQQEDKPDVDKTALLAFVVALIGGIAVYKGSQEEKKEYKYTLMGTGGLLILVSLWMGISAFSKDATKPDLLTLDVAPIEMKHQPVKEAIDDFLDEISDRMPQDIKLISDFFPSAEACILQRRPCHAVIGYDIENGFPDFMKIYQNSVLNGGYGLVVTKDPDQATNGSKATIRFNRKE